MSSYGSTKSEPARFGGRRLPLHEGVPSERFAIVWQIPDEGTAFRATGPRNQWFETPAILRITNRRGSKLRGSAWEMTWLGHSRRVDPQWIHEGIRRKVAIEMTLILLVGGGRIRTGGPCAQDERTG